MTDGGGPGDDVISDGSGDRSTAQRILRRAVSVVVIVVFAGGGLLLNDRARQRAEVSQLLDATVHAEQLALDMTARGSLTGAATADVRGVRAVDVRPWHRGVREARTACITYVVARVAYVNDPARARRPDAERRRARTALEAALPWSSTPVRTRIERVLRDS